MKKRVGLARAIVYEPQIVLYDEPTTGLDPVVSDSIDELMVAVRDRLNVTSVVVTHDMRSARRLGQHVIMLHPQEKIHKNWAFRTKFSILQDPIIHMDVDARGGSQESLVLQSEFFDLVHPQSKIKFISHFIKNDLYWVIIKKPANGTH